MNTAAMLERRCQLLCAALAVSWPLTADGVCAWCDSSWSIGVYENAMYVITLKDYASLVNDTAPASAAKWLAKAAAVSSSAMAHLWDTARQKFRPH